LLDLDSGIVNNLVVTKRWVSRQKAVGVCLLFHIIVFYFFLLLHWWLLGGEFGDCAFSKSKGGEGRRESGSIESN